MHLSLTAITSLSALSSVVLAAPLAARQSDSQCINGLKKIFTPELHNIYIYKDVSPFPSTSTILNVMNGSSSGSVQDQVAQWSGIPATATTCTIGWAVTAERSFSVYGNGLIQYQQLPGLPPADTNVTAETIAPFKDQGARDGSIDFTFWPEVAGPHVHKGGMLDCGNDITVYLSKDMVNGGPGSVALEQNAQNGLYLEVNC